MFNDSQFGFEGSGLENSINSKGSSSVFRNVGKFLGIGVLAASITLSSGCFSPKKSRVFTCGHGNHRVVSLFYNGPSGPGKVELLDKNGVVKSDRKYIPSGKLWAVPIGQFDPGTYVLRFSTEGNGTVRESYPFTVD